MGNHFGKTEPLLATRDPQIIAPIAAELIKRFGEDRQLERTLRFVPSDFGNVKKDVD